jgi:hypothetical protein
LVAFAWDRTRSRRAPVLDAGGALVPAAAPKPHLPIWAGVACLAVFVAVMAPWWARQLMVFGSLSPSTASGKVLFIRDIGEWNSVGTPADLGHLLGMGIGPLIATRIGGFIAAAWIYVVLVCGIVLAAPLALGAWARRRSEDFLPFFAYGGLLFLFSGLVSAIHVPGGTFIHSAVALAPHSYILALEGVGIGVAWVAARRPAWKALAATRVFTTAAIAFSLMIAWFGVGAVHSQWAVRRDRIDAVADALDSRLVPRSDLVMSIDAASTRYATGHGGVVLVNDDLGTILQVAFAYDIRWLVLDATDGVAAVKPILDGTERPPWIGEPIYLEPGSLGVYPVCLADPNDQRCFGPG